MSSSDWPTRRAAALLLAGLALSGVAGCGFQPVYGSAGYTAAAQDTLSQIEIAPVGDRASQQLRNELIRLLSPGGEPVDGLYLMTLKISIRERKTFVSSTRDVDRKVVSITAEYRLVDKAAHEAAARGGEDIVVYQNTAFAEASYNRFPSEFANIRARIDAENIAAREVAKIIQTQLAGAAATGQV